MFAITFASIAIFLCTVIFIILPIVQEHTGLWLSNADSGETMTEVIDTLREQSYETLVFFTDKGEKLLDYTDYSESSVDLSGIQEKYLKRHHDEGLIIIHNHPKNRTFSYADLKTAGEFSASQMVLVTRPYVYYLSPRDSDWDDDFDGMLSYYEERYEIYARASEDSQNQLSVSTASNLWASELTMLDVADVYELDYQQVPNSK